MKMARFASFTLQNEEEMMIVINKLEKMTENILVTIEDMGRNAHLYSLDIREAGITLNQFIVDSNLQMSDTRVRFMPPNEEQQNENPLCEVRAILYKATLSLINTDLQWYICACEEEADDSSLLSCHSIGHDNTSNIINIICDPHSITRGYSLDGIHKLITCLDAINQEGFTVLSECKEEWRHHPRLFHLVNDYHKICLQTSQLYNELVRLLKGKLDSLLSVSLRWKEFVVNLVQDDYYQNYKEMTLHLNDDGRLTLSSDFKKSFAYICKHTVTFTRQFEEALQELKPVKVLAKVSSGLIAGVFGVMTAYMVDLGPFQWMEVKTFTCVWLHLIRSFPWNSLLWKHKPMIIKEFFDIDSLLREAKHIMEDFCLASKEDVMIVIDTAAEKMGKLSVTIEEMSRHAQKCSDDVIKAGKTLELISHSHMLPIKRKR